MQLAASLFPHMLEQIQRTASAIIFNHSNFSGIKTSGERDKHICTEKNYALKNDFVRKTKSWAIYFSLNDK